MYFRLSAFVTPQVVPRQILFEEPPVSKIIKTNYSSVNRFLECMHFACNNDLKKIVRSDSISDPVKCWTDRCYTCLFRIRFLVEEGYEDKLLISHDIHTKNRLTKYGGHGYSHILTNIVPKMNQRGFSQCVIDKILVGNPKRWLTFK